MNPGILSLFVVTRVLACQAGAAMPVDAPPEVLEPSSSLGQTEAPMSNASDILDKKLRLSPSQREKLDPVIAAHFRRVHEIEYSAGLTKSERRSQALASWKQLESELAPSLDAEQRAKLSKIIKEIESCGGPVGFKSIVPLVALKYGRYYPSDATARNIFGDSTSSFSVGIGDFYRSPSKRYIVGFDFSSLTVENSDNKLFVLSPQLSAEYRVPIVGDLSAYSGVSVGPAYMDYSYDTPASEHFGAKRLGAAGEFAVGLRYGRFQLSAAYHAMTRPSNLSFDGLGISLTWIAVRF